MVAAIGSSPAFTVATQPATSSAGIEAQIARDKKELSNCVNCASAETKQGQADIQALSSKISAAEARLQEVATTNPAEQAAAPTPAPTPALDSTQNPGLASGLIPAQATTPAQTTASEIEASDNAKNPNAAATAAENKSNNDPAAALNTSDSVVGRFVNEYV